MKRETAKLYGYYMAPAAFGAACWGSAMGGDNHSTAGAVLGLFFGLIVGAWAALESNPKEARR